MTLPFESFLKRLNSIHFSESERTRAQSFLRAHIATTPIPRPAWHTRRSAFAFSFLGLVLLSAGVMTLSEAAVPGDVTYQIKVGITEPLREVVTISEEQDLSWEVTKAERRMEEIELLATENGF